MMQILAALSDRFEVYGVPRQSADTSGWSRARIGRATEIGWATSLTRNRRSTASWSPRQPGRPYGGRRRFGRTSSGCRSRSRPARYEYL
jgi:hypothetical protein